MKKYFFQPVLFVILFFNFILWAQGNVGTKEEIIGTVNGENLYLNEFNRLFNVQNKKYEKEFAREIILNQMIDRLLVLQEAKLKNLNVNEAEINRRLDLIKEKQGGEEAFTNFLAQNDATIEDAKNEIKYQILFDFLKNSIETKDGKSFKSFISAKKINSDIVIFTSKINPQKDKAAISENKPDQTESVIRTKEYPTITKSRVKEVEQLDEETKNIITEIERSITEVVNPEINTNTGIDPKPAKRKFRFISERKDNNVPLLNEEQIIALNSRTKHNSNYVIEDDNNTSLPSSQQNQLAIDINKVTGPLILDPIGKNPGNAYLIKPNKTKKTLGLFKKQLTLNPINPLKKKLEKRSLLKKPNEPVIITSTSTEPIKVTKEIENINDPILLTTKENEITDDLELIPNEENEEIIISDALTIGNTSLKDDSSLNNKSDKLKELIRKIEQRKLSSK